MMVDEGAHSWAEDFRQRRDGQGGGRGKLAFETAENLEEAIHEYFSELDGRTVQVVTKDGVETIQDPKPPSVVGLCLWLGISRQTLLNYKVKQKFGHVIARAMQVIENGYEGALMSRDQSNGAKFNLNVNFGWIERKALELSGPEGEPISFAELENFERTITPIDLDDDPEPDEEAIREDMENRGDTEELDDDEAAAGGIF